MNCVDLRVVEWWRLDGALWSRVPEMEIVIEEPET